MGHLGALSLLNTGLCALFFCVRRCALHRFLTFAPPFTQEMRGQLRLCRALLREAKVRLAGLFLSLAKMHLLSCSWPPQILFPPVNPLTPPLPRPAPPRVCRSQYFQKEADLEDLREKLATLQTIESSTTTVSHVEKLQAKIKKAEGEAAKSRQRCVVTRRTAKDAPALMH